MKGDRPRRFVLPTSPACFCGARLACEADLEGVATLSLGFVGQAVLVVVLVLESCALSVGVLEYCEEAFTVVPAMSAFIVFTGLINEMAIANVDDTIAASSQVLVVGYHH